MSDLAQLRSRHVAGAAAGNITVAGIKLGDRIIEVSGFGLTEAAPNTFSGIVDLTSEFTVTADNTINNTGGTSSAAKILHITWETVGGGRALGRSTTGRAKY